jgi:hypothetical protein
MDVDGMIDYVQLHGFQDLSDAQVLAALNLAYRDLNNAYLWEYLAYQQTTPTVASSPNIGSGLSFPLRAVARIQDLTNNTILLPIRRDEAYGEWYSTTTGTPFAYHVFRDQASKTRLIALTPTPSGVYQMLVTYYIQPQALVIGGLETDIFVPVEFHDVLINGTLARLYNLNDDANQAQLFQALYNAGVQGMVAADGLSQVDRPDTIKVLLDYDEEMS